MEFCNYTNFDTLFPSVVINFSFLRLNQYFEIAKFVYSWVSRDVINFTGVNSKLIHSHRREITFHCMCWPFVCQQICAIFWDLFTPVQHNHHYILGSPTLRFTTKCPSETQEFLFALEWHVQVSHCSKKLNWNPCLYSFTRHGFVESRQFYWVVATRQQ